MSPGQVVYPYEYENVSLLPNDTANYEIEEKQCEQSDYDRNDDDEKSNDARKKLLWAGALCVVFMVVELTGGYLAGSLAIMSDAAHLITDSLTFLIGVFGITWARKGPSPRMSFGYKRVEVFCAIISVIGIWILTLFILYFAVQRLRNLDGFEINVDTMLVVSFLGILVNIVMAGILHGGVPCHISHHNHSHGGNLLNHQHSHSDEAKFVPIDDNSRQAECKSAENINVQAAFLHVLGDFIQSIGVIIAAVIIKIYPEAKIVDPLITFLFSIIVICTTIKVFRESSAILLEAVPKHISYEKLKIDLENIEGVSAVHDLRVWSLSSDLHLLNVNIVISDSKIGRNVLSEATRISKQYKISKMTIQIDDK